MQRGRRRQRMIRSASVAAFVILGCGCVGSIDRNEFAREYQARGGGLSGDRLVDVAQSIEDRVAPADMIIRSATVSHLGVSMTVSTSERPNETDTWYWSQSGLSGPSPSSNLDDEAVTAGFDAAILDAETIEQAIDRAVAISTLRNPYAGSVSFRGLPGGSYEATVSVTNDRGNELFRFGPDGVVVAVA